MQTIETKIDKILSETEAIKRGLYGDEFNKRPGLMQEHYELKADVVKLKEGRKKIMWLSAGFIFAVELVYFIIKEMKS